MTRLLLLFAGLLFACSANAQIERFFLGTMPGSGSNGIYTATLDAATGHLGDAKKAGGSPYQPFLSVTHDGRYLYANSVGSNAEVLAYRVGQEGVLQELNNAFAGNGSCHVSVDASGHHVFVANYAGGDVACFSTTTNGGINPTQLKYLRFTGSGPNRDRQSHPYLHFTGVDASNRHLYACDLGCDKVWIFDLDATGGEPVPAKIPYASVPPGSGPRHLAFSPDQKTAYVNGEMGMNVTVFARDSHDGSLTPIQTLGTLPAEAQTNEMTTAEIACHPGGKWLYVSNRDLNHQGRDSLTVFVIGKDGRLARIQNTASRVDLSRAFAIDPSGRWLIVAGQVDGLLAVHAIDQQKGTLTFTGEIAKAGSPVCLVFAPVR